MLKLFTTLARGALADVEEAVFDAECHARSPSAAAAGCRRARAIAA